MNIGIGGNLSSGKTLLAIAIMKDIIEQDKKKVISNIKLNLPKYVYAKNEILIDFIKKNMDNEENIKKMFFNSILIIDEARNLFSSRKSMSNLNELVTQFCMMLGKLDCDFIYTFQLIQSQIDKQLREITDLFIFTERVKEDKTPVTERKRILNYPILIKCTLCSLDNEKLVKTNRIFYLEPKNFYNLYNTREIVLLDRDKYLKK